MIRSESLSFCLLAAGMALVCRAAPGLEPSEVLILVNKDAPLSSQVARVYQQLRGIPAENVFRLALGPDHQIARERYHSAIAVPVKKYLSEHPNIRCLVATAGFPYSITTTPGSHDGAALDNELAAVLRDEPKDWNGWQPNPLYLRGQNLYGQTDPRLFQMVYVARLEAPDLQTIEHMITDAILTEDRGLEGPVFGDARGLDGNTDYAAADTAIRGAIDRLSAAGFPATLDMNEADWRQPPGGVGDQAAGAAFYLGWYSYQNFQDIFGQRGLARGAIAWHVASGEAVSPWDAKTREWCPNLLRRGAAVTIGPAFEPYVAAFPRADVLVEQLLQGKSIAESYWLALPHVSWAMALFADPLYRPFAKPKPALIPRAYVSTAANHVLGAGQTSSLLVQVECIGPPGSALPALSATAESGKGLAAASGSISIPALKAGQSAVIRVPKVTAGSDATGAFRLYLNSTDVKDPSRRLVLEGRTGFSMLSGGIERQGLMFPSSKGSYVISGRPGAAFVTESLTLRRKPVPIPTGWGLFGAAFSPDESHIALTFVQPEEKRVVFAIADSALTTIHELSPGTQFLRWQDNATILAKRQDGLIQHNLTTGAVTPVSSPSGWSANSVIPGSDIVILMTGEGRTAVRTGSEPQREVLSAVMGKRDIAVANDLSLFGAIDNQKRLWIQDGWSGSPAVIAENVGRVSWGPISRRVLVQGSDQQVRIYNGREHSWTPLGLVVAAQWSLDENSLLYIAGERGTDAIAARSLTLLAERSIQPLCDLSRIGEVAGMTIMDGDEDATLLAGANDSLAVWMIGLPRQAASPPDPPR
jgi:uncharacterized protein (TIGR03790 family)